MNRIIWTCWWHGRETAPQVVERCLRSWERRNPGWEFRCVDARTVRRYVPVASFIDLGSQSVGPAALSEIVRIALLHEYGGVWADATLFCNRPLDEWLLKMMSAGFFALEAPGDRHEPDARLLAAEVGNPLIAAWASRVQDHWTGRAQVRGDSWLRHLFERMCEEDAAAAAVWRSVPAVGAPEPLSLRPAAEARDSVDRQPPVLDLADLIGGDIIPLGSLLDELLEQEADAPAVIGPDDSTDRGRTPDTFSELCLRTKNRGDHIQILAGRQVMDRLGIVPSHQIDRDNELDTVPALGEDEGTSGILLNGWFKSGSGGWPPSERLSPLLYSFHIRPKPSPALLGPDSIAYLRRHEPIGCRDLFTTAALQERGVAAFTTNCLTLGFPRRLSRPATQTETFVVSRDDAILGRLPASLGPHRFVNHYSGTRDCAANLASAQILLDRYRDRARLIVTTLLHCALPAIAMGIPVVMFYPLNTASGHASDRERFSSLAALLPIYSLDAIEEVDWEPAPIDTGLLKLRLFEGVYAMAAKRWNLAPAPPIGPIAGDVLSGAD